MCVFTNFSPPPPLDVVLIHHSPPAAPPRRYFENAGRSQKHPALPSSSSGQWYTTTPSVSAASLLISHVESPHKRYGNAFQTGTKQPLLTSNYPSQWVSCSFVLNLRHACAERITLTGVRMHASKVGFPGIPDSCRYRLRMAPTLMSPSFRNLASSHIRLSSSSVPLKPCDARERRSGHHKHATITTMPLVAIVGDHLHCGGRKHITLPCVKHTLHDVGLSQPGTHGVLACERAT